MKNARRIAVQGGLKTALYIAALALTNARPFAQAQQKPSFDVVSIKPSAPLGNGPISIGGGAQGDRLTLSNATLRMLLQRAFQQVTNNAAIAGPLQIIGGPGWMDSDRYDVQAKADCSGGRIPREQLQLMVQSLLEERFKLKAHMETRELPVYELVAAKDGPKIRRSADQTPAAPPLLGLPAPCAPAPAAGAFPGLPPFTPGSAPPRGSIYMSIGGNSMTMRATATPLATVIGMLQQQLGRRVVDKTGLDGLYDFELTFSPEGLDSPFGRGFALPPPGAAGPAGGAASQPTASEPVASLFTAIQELGLKLESTKGPVPVLVIDSVEKPTEN